VVDEFGEQKLLVGRSNMEMPNGHFKSKCSGIFLFFGHIDIVSIGPI